MINPDELSEELKKYREMKIASGISPNIVDTYIEFRESGGEPESDTNYQIKETEEGFVGVNPKTLEAKPISGITPKKTEKEKTEWEIKRDEALASMRKDIQAGVSYKDIMKFYRKGAKLPEYSIENEWESLVSPDKPQYKTKEEYLKNPVYSETYKEPEKLTSKQKTDYSLWYSSEKEFNKVVKQYKKMEGQTGLWPGAVSRYGRRLKLGNKNVTNLDVSITGMKLQIMNAMIGTQMTKPEMEAIKPLIPDILDPDYLIKQKLNNLQSYIRNKKSAISGGNEWEVVK